MTDDKTREAMGLAIEEAVNMGPVEGVSFAGRIADAILARFDIRERSAEPSEAAVEAAARALFDLELGWDADFNTEVHENVRDRFFNQARAALTAARAASGLGTEPPSRWSDEQVERAAEMVHDGGEWPTPWADLPDRARARVRRAVRRAEDAAAEVTS